ncbi:MAG: cell division protein ZapA [Clostridia bacterium]|nr:cell division protein ZapA [Clostridia bacterium]
MLNRVIVTIDGFDYTVISEDEEAHIRRSAELVDQSIQEIKRSSTLASLPAAVLAAMNIADKYYRVVDSGDGLRAQIKDYAEECARLRAELARLKRN